jgi:hypothetical protein
LEVSKKRMDVNVFFKLLSDVHTLRAYDRKQQCFIPALLPLPHAHHPSKPGQTDSFAVEAWRKGGVSILGFFPGSGKRAVGTLEGPPDFIEPH